MPRFSTDLDTGTRDDMSRRGFLRRAALAGSAVWLADRSAPIEASAAGPAAESHLTDVFEVTMAGAVVGRAAHPTLVEEMLSHALTGLAGVGSVGQAWRRFVGDDDTILVKFNRSGAQTLGTTDGLARAIVQTLGRADISPEQVMLLETQPSTAEELGTRIPPSGWSDKEYDFGSGKDQFLAALDQATAIINVPYLKNHNLAGMTGGLKNLSHGLVKHPGRYHNNGCSPYIADLVSCEAIRPKLRLTIMNALRVMVDQGPQAPEEFVDPAYLLVLSKDPVAADTCGLIWLNRLRKERGLSPIGAEGERLPYLTAAQRRGLGTAEIQKISRKLLSM